MSYFVQYFKFGQFTSLVTSKAYQELSKRFVSISIVFKLFHKFDFGAFYSYTQA